MTLLSELTTLRLGGPARRLLSCHDEASLLSAIRDADAQGERLLLLAGGSNVVVPDEGFPGTGTHICTSGVRYGCSADRAVLDVAAGEPWDGLVERCVDAGLAGFECMAGIPGSVGATPIQNVGAYGQEVSESVVLVRAYDRARRQIVELSPSDCRFAYRSSLFKRTPGRWVVLAVSFALERSARSKPVRYDELARALGIEVGGAAPLRAVRDAVLSLRRKKGMVIDPTDPDTVSAGSFFLNPILDTQEWELLLKRVAQALGSEAHPPRFPQADGRVKTSAAWLIERAGFHRGYGNPRGIAISSKHTLALTNRGEGTTSELLALAEEIAAGVQRSFGIRLSPEPVLVDYTWGVSPG